MLAPVTHISPLATIRRERLLVAPGKVVVRKGQKVNATDVIAEANLNPAPMLLDIARGLGVSIEKADEALKCSPGDQVAEGDLLAGPVGFPRRVMRAPQPGKVLLAGSGQVLIEAQTKPFELKAAIPGIVTDLIDERGAIIETTGAVVQGVWGNGGLDYGLMFVKATAPGEVLAADALDVSLRGYIVLAGHVAEADVLKSAANLPLRGLILASMDPSLIELARTMPFPVMIIEGFGRRSMNAAAFKLLSTNQRREVALNAESWDRFSGARPEVVIPLPDQGSAPLLPQTVEYEPGQKVRIVRAPYASKTGTLVELAGTKVLPSGIRALAAEVRLDDGETVITPLANLDVLR